MVTYLAIRPPKLQTSSVLLIGVLLFLVGVLFFLLLVVIIIVLLFRLLVLLGMIVWLGWLLVQPQVKEDVGDIIIHGRS